MTLMLPNYTDGLENIGKQKMSHDLCKKAVVICIFTGGYERNGDHMIFTWVASKFSNTLTSLTTQKAV